MNITDELCFNDFSSLKAAGADMNSADCAVEIGFYALQVGSKAVFFEGSNVLLMEYHLFTNTKIVPPPPA